MSPQEKAKEIAYKFNEYSLMVADEILEATKQPIRDFNSDIYKSTSVVGYYYSDFWQEVKSEIEKL